MGRIYQTRPNVVILTISKAIYKLLRKLFRITQNYSVFRNSGISDYLIKLIHRVFLSSSEKTPHLALSSSFNTFRSITPPASGQNRLVGKLILGSLVIVFIMINQLALFDAYTVDLRHMSIKAKEGGPISRKLAAGAPLPIDPTIEQQINITDQEYSTQNITDSPTDNSLGLVRYTAASYTSPTTYFEAVIKNSNSSTTTASLYDSTGVYVANSSVTATGATYTRVRSAPITLTTGTDYTVRLRSSPGSGTISSGTASIIAARIIVIQSSDSTLTNTETQN